MTLRQARSEHLTMRAIPKMPEIEDKKVRPLDRYICICIYTDRGACARGDKQRVQNHFFERVGVSGALLLPCVMQPVVSTDEMRLVFDYIDNFQGGDGLIEYGEMETAFRR